MDSGCLMILVECVFGCVFGIGFLITDNDLISDSEHDGRENALSYSNKWIVEGDQIGNFDDLAERNGFRYLGKVDKVFVKNFHILEKFDQPEINHEESSYHTNKLKTHANIIWAKQLHHKELHKRDLQADVTNFMLKNYYDYEQEPDSVVHELFRRKSVSIEGSLMKRNFADTNIKEIDGRIRSEYNQEFNDELWPLQWYELGYRIGWTKSVLDMHLVPVYREYNITGNGINVIIIDDGIEYTHDDIQDNFSEQISYNLNRNTTDVLPRYEDPRNRHGTRCAGVIIMQADNRKCGVGIAYNAKVGGITLLDGATDDLMEAKAVTYANDKVHIYSGSWGPEDNGQSFEGPGRLLSQALLYGITNGRDGLGSLYVFAAGNGGVFADHCGADGYVNSIYSIAVTSATQDGDIPYYAERCPAIIATTYSGSAHDEVKIITTDLHNTCTMEHSGTSASAPLVAGILALVLEANGNLTWRDFQHLLIMSSETEQLKRTVDWSRNGKGLWFTPQFGFGLINAHKMVTTAKSWKIVPEKFICRIPFNLKNKGRLFFPSSPFIASVNAGGKCENRIQYLEHVQLDATVSYTKRGHIEVLLTSPSATASKLLEPRQNDKNQMNLKSWPFLSLQFWGENPEGSWTVVISDQIRKGRHQGSVEKLELILHGTQEMPEHYREQSKTE